MLYYRLWRDVWQGVTSVYYNLFRSLEELLDPNDDMHLHCLYTIYMPGINQHLAIWQSSWNSHPSSSCSNIIQFSRYYGSNNLIVGYSWSWLWHKLGWSSAIYPGWWYRSASPWSRVILVWGSITAITSSIMLKSSWRW